MTTLTTAQLEWLRQACYKQAEAYRAIAEEESFGIAKGLALLREEQYEDLTRQLSELILSNDKRISIKR